MKRLFKKTISDRLKLCILGFNDLIKSELSCRMSADTTIDKAITLSVINSIIRVAIGAVSRGEIVQVVGFGTFISKKRKGRLVTIPLTSNQVKIPTVNSVKFITGKRFIESVNKKR